MVLGCIPGQPLLGLGGDPILTGSLQTHLSSHWTGPSSIMTQHSPSIHWCSIGFWSSAQPLCFIFISSALSSSFDLDHVSSWLSLLFSLLPFSWLTCQHAFYGLFFISVLIPKCSLTSQFSIHNFTNHTSKTIKTIASAAIRMQDLQLLCLGIKITIKIKMFPFIYSMPSINHIVHCLPSSALRSPLLWPVDQQTPEGPPRQLPPQSGEHGVKHGYSIVNIL